MKIVLTRESYKKLGILTAYFIFALVLCSRVIIHRSMSAVEWASYLSWYVLVLFVIQCIIMKLLSVKFFSLEFLFIVLTYVFYLGQTYLLSVSYDFGELAYQISYIRYGTDAYVESTKYSFVCIAFAYLGLMLGTKGEYPYHIANRENAGFRMIGIDKISAQIMFLISAPFELYSTFSKVYSMLTSTYSTAHDVGGGTVVEFMTGVFFISIIFFLMNSSEEPIRCRRIFVVILAYEAFTMITGQRAMGIIKIFICVYVYYKNNGKLSWKTVLKLVVGILIAAYALVVIRNSRASGLSLATLNFTTNGFLLYDVLSEFGITGRVVTAAFANIDEFAHGKSIGCGFLAIIPGWTYIFGGDLLSKYYTYEALSQQAWGSSFISDLYFDFGFYGGIFASTIYTFIVGKFFCKFRELLSEKSFSQASLFAYFALQLIFTVRSYIFRLPRYFVYVSVVYLFCYLLMKGQYRTTQSMRSASQKRE